MGVKSAGVEEAVCPNCKSKTVLYTFKAKSYICARCGHVWVKDQSSQLGSNATAEGQNGWLSKGSCEQIAWFRGTKSEFQKSAKIVSFRKTTPLATINCTKTAFYAFFGGLKHKWWRHHKWFSQNWPGGLSIWHWVGFGRCYLVIGSRNGRRWHKKCPKQPPVVWFLPLLSTSAYPSAFTY